MKERLSFLSLHPFQYFNLLNKFTIMQAPRGKSHPNIKALIINPPSLLQEKHRAIEGVQFQKPHIEYSNHSSVFSLGSSRQSSMRNFADSAYIKESKVSSTLSKLPKMNNQVEEKLKSSSRGERKSPFEKIARHEKKNTPNKQH